MKYNKFKKEEDRGQIRSLLSPGPQAHGPQLSYSDTGPISTFSSFGRGHKSLT